MRETSRGTVRLSTGRELYANCVLVSLREHEGKWQLTEGYDGHLCDEWPLLEDASDWDREQMLSNEELREVAQHMIARWQAFVAALDEAERPKREPNSDGRPIGRT